jgi:hypothetical protein
MEFDAVLLSALVPAIVALIMMCLLSCLRCGRRQPSISRGLPTTTSTIYTVPTNYSAVSSNPPPVPVHSAPPASFAHNRISSLGDRWAVPIELLPPTFDYTTPGVEHKGNYVLVKDLNLIESISKDEYQKQSPYNPNYT